MYSDVQTHLAENHYAQGLKRKNIQCITNKPILETRLIKIQ